MQLPRQVMKWIKVTIMILIPKRMIRIRDRGEHYPTNYFSYFLKYQQVDRKEHNIDGPIIGFIRTKIHKKN